MKEVRLADPVQRANHAIPRAVLDPPSQKSSVHLNVEQLRQDHT